MSETIDMEISPDSGGVFHASLSLDAIAQRLHERQLATKAVEPPVVRDPAGVLGGITEIKVWDIPVGQAVVGGFTAVFASELVDGFLAAQSVQVRGMVKLLAAGAAVKWSGGILGSTGSKALALLLAFDGIRDLLPIDLWAQKGANMLSGAVTRRGLVQGRDTTPVIKQAEGVVRNYYQQPFARR